MPDYNTSTPVDHSKNIIEVKGVSFSYGRIEALKNISLEIHQGDYVGVIGPNGSGKTTLLKIMLGLLKPQAGSVRLFGQDIKDFHDWGKISYVPQKTARFDANFPATVEEVAAMGRYLTAGLFHGATADDKQAVQNALRQVDMWRHKDRLIGDLSGGQEQRVFIARALANQPRIIFLDEPTTGVDQKSRDELYAILRQLNNSGITLALVSHDIERITKEVMHIACVNKTLTCHVSPEEYLNQSRSANINGQNVKIIPHHHH